MPGLPRASLYRGAATKLSDAERNKAMPAHLLCVLLYLCPTQPSKPMPSEFYEFEEAEALEEADVAASRVANVEREAREATAAWAINGLLDSLNLQP